MPVIQRNITKTKIKYNGRYVYGMKVVSTTNKSFGQMESIAKSISDELKDQQGQGKLWVSLRYKTGWKKSTATDYGDQPKLFSYDEYDDEDVEYTQSKFNQIYVSFMKTHNGVGADINNDCLYWSIFTVLKGNMPAMVNSPAKFKRRIQLARKDMVPVDRFDMVEQQCKVRLFVEGQETYISKRKQGTTVNLVMTKNHVEVKETDLTTKRKNELLPVRPIKKRLAMMRYFEGEILLFTGKEELKLTPEEFTVKRKELAHQYIIVKAPTKVKTMKELKDEFFEWKKKANQLYENSNEYISIYQFGSFGDCVKKLLHDFTSEYEMEPVSAIENEFLATTGGLMTAKKGIYEHAYLYDINSCYPSLLSKMSIPIKEGEIITVDKLDDILQYGMYKCIISRSTDVKLNVLFRFSSKNLYSHYDIQTARKLGLNIELVQEPNNAIIWTQDRRVTGAKAFRKLIDYLYKLKLDGTVFSKVLLSNLWGALCRKQVYKNVINKDDEFEIKGDCNIASIFPRSKNLMRVDYVKNTKPFKTSYARLGPFLTAYARQKMAFALLPHKDSVIRIHTDGVISTKPMPELKLSKDLGDWKLEGFGVLEIHNTMKYSWIN